MCEIKKNKNKNKNKKKIIAQSLSSLAGGSGEGRMKKVFRCMQQGAEIQLDSYFAIKKYNILFYQRHNVNREFPRTSFMATYCIGTQGDLLTFMIYSSTFGCT